MEKISKITLRIPEELNRQLTEKAKMEELSKNQFLKKILRKNMKGGRMNGKQDNS